MKKLSSNRTLVISSTKKLVLILEVSFYQSALISLRVHFQEIKVLVGLLVQNTTLTNHFLGKTLKGVGYATVKNTTAFIVKFVGCLLTVMKNVLMMHGAQEN